MKRTVLLLTTLSLAAFTNAQDAKSRYLKDGDSEIQISVSASNKWVRTTPERTYHWYKNQQVHATVGGFDGMVLHGEYVERYENEDIKVKGRFRRGVKAGQWETWYTGGQIKERSQWRFGVLNGTFMKYDEKGQLTQSAQYKKGLLHGEKIVYSNGDEDMRVEYKKGIQVNAPLPGEQESSKKKKPKEVKPTSPPPVTN